MQFTKDQREAWEKETRDSAFNRWLRDQVSHSDGTLDLLRLYDVAESYGIPARERYGHLNAGQQRMNVGNSLRSRVPASVYAHYGTGGASASAAPRKAGATAPVEKHEHSRFAEVPSADLMNIYGQVLDELRGRGVVRTRNSPVGDYAEYLFSTAFGWSLEANSTSGYDAVDGEGTRYQVKCRRVCGGGSGERQLGVFRDLPAGKFDILAAVLLDAGFKVLRAALIPRELISSRAAYVPHVNGWRFTLDDEVWALPGVIDATAELLEGTNNV